MNELKDTNKNKEFLIRKLDIKCFKHVKEPIWEEEVHRDLLPEEVQVYTSYNIYWCKKCKDKKKVLEDFNYWRGICDQVGVPDLKYWNLEYVRRTGIFKLTIPNVLRDNFDRNDDSPTQWTSTIERSELVGVIEDKEKFRKFITLKLKELGKKVKETRF